MQRFSRALAVVCAAVVASGVTPLFARQAAAVDLPVVRIGDATMWEGDGGRATVNVPVDLSVPSATVITVRYAITTDSALGGSDFITRSGTLKFAAGVATRPLPVRILGDENVEPDEHIAITLSAPVGATIDKSSGGVWVMDDDAEGVEALPMVSVGTVSTVEADAGTHLARIAVTLSRPAAVPIIVAYSLSCGTAVSGTDFIATRSGSLTFPAGSQSKDLTIRVLPDQSAEALVETVLDKLQVVAGPAVVRISSGTGLIVDDGSGPLVPPLQPGDIRRVSVDSEGGQAEFLANPCDGMNPPMGSLWEQISANGRYVVFSSDASSLDPRDTNAVLDVFVHDLETGTTELVSLGPDGNVLTTAPGGLQGSIQPSISADGRYVTFTFRSQLYLRDRVAGTTELVSVASDGTVGQGTQGRISADGRYVAFLSGTSTLAGPPVTTGEPSIYLRDRVTGTTRRLVQPQDLGFGDDFSMSTDGSMLVFNDTSSLVADDTNGCRDTYVMAIGTGALDRVSVTSSEAQQLPGNYSECSYRRPFISADGRFVGFSSGSWSLYPGATGPKTTGAFSNHGYVRDRLLGTTTLVDVVPDVPADTESILTGLSDDGRYVTHLCRCGETLPIYGPDFGSMWKDLATGETAVVGQRPDGVFPVNEEAPSYFSFTWTFGGISADGHTVAFDSLATNLADDDSNDARDVFVQSFS